MPRTKRSNTETSEQLSRHERRPQRIEQMAKRLNDPKTPIEERADLAIKLVRMIYNKPEPIYVLYGEQLDEQIEMTRSE